MHTAKSDASEADGVAKHADSTITTWSVVRLTRESNMAAAQELVQYKAEAAARIAEASAAAAGANERAAVAEREAARAKESAVLLEKQLLEMKRTRRLEKSHVEGLRTILTSEAFKIPGLCVDVGSIVDAEAQAFAMEFIHLFRSCGITVYAPAGFPAETIVSGPPSPDGLIIRVNSTANPQPAFVVLQRFLHDIGLSSEVKSDPKVPPNHLNFVVAKKPDL